MSKNTLETLRHQIDAIDLSLLKLLNRRADIVSRIGGIKREKGEEVYVPQREKSLLDRLCRANKGSFPEHALRAVFREILSASRSLQSPMKAAYLGPAATFSHQAATRYFGHSTELIPEATLSKVFDAVEHHRAHFGVVPIENTTEGMVGPTLDAFMDSNLKIAGEIVLPISHHLMSRLHSLKGVQRIYTHPQPAGQCRAWLDQNVPGIPLIEVDSTARAAERAAGDEESAAIAGEQASEIYGLKFLKKHIEDHPNNMTRFVVLGRKSPERSGSDKTSLLFSVKDEAGILFKMLEPFSRQGINLTKIESRPIKKKAWQYIFFLDIDGHMEDKKVARAIQELESRCLFLKILGSYPKAS